MLANKIGDINPENDFGYGLQLFSRNLLTIGAVCKLNGIDLVLLSQPSSVREDSSVSEEAFHAYNTEIEKVATEQGIRFIDMFSKMGHDERFFFDKVHYTPEGVERFADIMFSEVSPLVSELERWQFGRTGNDSGNEEQH